MAQKANIPKSILATEIKNEKKHKTFCRDEQKKKTDGGQQRKIMILTQSRSCLVIQVTAAKTACLLLLAVNWSVLIDNDKYVIL